LELKYRRVHELIQDYAARYHLRMDYAAMKLAADNGISISKYAGDDYYNAVAGKGGTSFSSLPVNQNITSFSSTRKNKFPTIKIDLSKIKNKTLQHMLERDVKELNYAIEAGTDKTSKTCMILSGSIAEALLLERLTQKASIKSQAITVAASLTNYRPSNVNDIES